MNKRILLNSDLVLDFVFKRTGFPYAEKIFKLIFEGKIDAFICSTTIQKIAISFENKQPNRVEWNNADLKSILAHARIITVTGHEVMSTLAEDGSFEEELMVKSAMRIDNSIIVLSNHQQYQKDLRVMQPEQFIKEYTTQSQAKEVNIKLLDLSREYHLMMEKIDHSLLSLVASSEFIMGTKLADFEAECTEYLGVKHAIGTSSGTEALVLSLRALAIQRKSSEFFTPTDLVITTPFTFTATGGAILRAGATPLFVDTEPHGFNLDVDNIIRLIESDQINPDEVVGILPVHLFGHSCQVDPILDLAAEYGWFVLEDVAQAFGGRWKQQKLGTIGTLGAFSFFPTKNLGGYGDGGLIATDEDNLNDLCRMLLRHGGQTKYNVEHIGYNARLDTIQAAILQIKLEYVDLFNKKRRQIADFYNQSLSQIENIKTPHPRNDVYDVVHQYTIRLKPESRDKVQSRMTALGISSAIYYPVPLHKMKVFESRSQVAGDLSNAELLCEEVLSLPIEPLIDETELTRITQSLIRATVD